MSEENTNNITPKAPENTPDESLSQVEAAKGVEQQNSPEVQAADSASFDQTAQAVGGSTPPPAPDQQIADTPAEPVAQAAAQPQQQTFSPAPYQPPIEQQNYSYQPTQPQPQQPHYSAAPQQQPPLYQKYQQQSQPMYAPPAAPLTGGMKFGWFVVGAFGGLVGLLVAWLAMYDRHPEVKKEAIKFAGIGFGVGLLVRFLFMIMFAAIGSSTGYYYGYGTYGGYGSIW